MNITKVIILVLCTLGISVTAQDDNQESFRLIQEGDYLYRRALYDQALMKYNDAILISPNSASYYAKRAEALARLERFTEARQDYSKSLEISPLSDIYYDRRASLKYLEQDYFGAIADLKSAYDITKDIEYLDKSAKIQIDAGMYEKAIQYYEDLDSNHNDPILLCKEVFALMASDDLNKAKDLLEQYAHKFENKFIIQDIKGVIALLSEQPQEALSYFNKAININPFFAITYFNRAEAYLLLNQRDSAIADLEYAFLLDQSLMSAKFKKAVLLKQTGQFERADAYYKEILDQKNEVYPAIFNRGLTRKMLGDINGALAYYDEYIRAHPKDPKVFLMRGNSNLLFGHYDEAINDYNSALFINSDYHEALFNKGIAQLLKFQNNRACNNFRTAESYGSTKATEFINQFCNEP
ncbi:MAG: tetratricopeptide repeat protein [Flavobacteriales bacterium]|nr:tetratricopeptide repeat protein [Flavobacteriales bacterium]